MALQEALLEVKLSHGEEYLHTEGLDSFGGVFNFHPQKGSALILSSHAFGAAIDLNPEIAPFAGVSHQPDFIVKAFQHQGFTWGGEFPTSDGMHFQFGTGL